MHEIDGYRRAALSLKDLAVDEQEWILSQLDEQDRRRIERLLHEMWDPAATDAKEISTSAVIATVAQESSDAHLDLIKEAAFDVIAAVFNEQPDWAIAIIAAHCPKTAAVQESINQLPPDRVGRIRTWLASSRENIKPRVQEIVLRGIAADIKRRAASQTTVDFDAVLTRVANG